jgi:hypothetical protein
LEPVEYIHRALQPKESPPVCPDVFTLMVVPRTVVEDKARDISVLAFPLAYNPYTFPPLLELFAFITIVRNFMDGMSVPEIATTT